MAQRFDTIVVGMGAAGVTAAATLARAGRQVLGLEAQGQVGGRVCTIPVADGVVEVGAEWIHGTSSSRVYDLAVQNNVPLRAQDLNFEVFRSDGSKEHQELLNELMNYCLEVVDSPPDSPEPLGHFVTKKLMDYIKTNKLELLQEKDFITEVLAFMNLLINNYEASNDWNDVSAWTKYEELDGHQHMSWHTLGYGTYFDILLNRYSNGPGLPTLKTKLDTEVTQIAWPQDPTQDVKVKCKDGTTYTASNVIVTVSLGVLKERHTTLFAPKLPKDKSSAIQHISMGLIDKIIITFPEVWWPKNVTFYAFLWRGEDKRAVGVEDFWTTRIFGASSPMGSNNSLTLWTNGDVAKLVETLPEDVVKRKCMELLRKFMGAKVAVPEPIGLIRSTWYSNPYTRGSYTYDNLLVSQYPNARAVLAKPLTDSAGKPRVLFAGEATDEIHFSTVHGASDTGYREAMRLLPSTSKI